MIVYLGIRLTHPDNVYDPAWDAEYIGKILEVLQPLGEIKQHTYGHEVSVKSKRHHFHFHLSMDWDPQRKYIKGLASWIRRRLAEDHELVLPEGSNCCIKQFLQFKANTSPERWFGYVFKDMKDLEDQSKKDPWAWPDKHNHGFPPEDIHDMWCRATTEREIAIKQYQKHENKLNNDKQSRARLWEYLDSKIEGLPDDTLENPQCPLRIVCDHIIEYNIAYNDYRIPMDIKRRAVCYLAYKGMPAWKLRNIIL